MANVKIKEGSNWTNIALAIFKVGAIYTSTDSTSPATLFGGTWVALESRMLIGASSTYAAGSTGGAATVTLTAAQSGVPAHSHGTTITQPAFSTPKFTHSITQPVFKYTAPASHTHPLSKNGGALVDFSNVSGNYLIIHSTNSNVGVAQSAYAYHTFYQTSSSGNASERSTISKALVGNTDAATGAGTANGATASRTTNVAIGDHAATACTRTTNVGVTVNNNTAANASAAHENMPPYLAVYMWKRTA